jgi:hypothetical protein
MKKSFAIFMMTAALSTVAQASNGNNGNGNNNGNNGNHGGNNGNNGNHGGNSGNHGGNDGKGGSDCAAPEINAASAASAFVLLGGTMFVVSGRRKKRLN